MYPLRADDTNLAMMTPTPSSALIDMMSLTGNDLDVRLIQALSRLETAQLSLANVKMLNAEEESVVEVEPMGLIRTKVGAAKLGPGFVKLEQNIKDFASYNAALPTGDAEEFKKLGYNFFEMIAVLDGFCEAERNKACFCLCVAWGRAGVMGVFGVGRARAGNSVWNQKAFDRWNELLQGICDGYKAVIPSGWRMRCIDTMDEEFIKSKVVVPTLVEGLGADYVPVSQWLASLQEIPILYEHYKARFSDELPDHEATAAETLELVAVMLSYNSLLNKFPKMTPADRRQASGNFPPPKQKHFSKAGPAEQKSSRSLERTLRYQVP